MKIFKTTGSFLKISERVNIEIHKRSGPLKKKNKQINSTKGFLQTLWPLLLLVVRFTATEPSNPLGLCQNPTPPLSNPHRRRHRHFLRRFFLCSVDRRQSPVASISFSLSALLVLWFWAVNLIFVPQEISEFCSFAWFFLWYVFVSHLFKSRTTLISENKHFAFFS